MTLLVTACFTEKILVIREKKPPPKHAPEEEK
jgi:hypothetical protein